MSFPPGTEMFQFPGFASPRLCIQPAISLRRGCPIRTSADQRSLASPRGFSQRATSFIASWRQGIHRTPLSHSPSNHQPPARSTKPRHKPSSAQDSKPYAHSHSTQPFPDSPVKDHPPGRQLSARRQQRRFWKRSPSGQANPARADAAGSADSPRIGDGSRPSRHPPGIFLPQRQEKWRQPDLNR